MKTTNPIYNPNHLKIAFGSLSSSMSFWIQIPLIIIIMYELTDSPLKVTFANVLWSLPWSVLGGFAGRLSSKYNDKTIMVSARFLSLTSMITLGLFSLFGYLNVSIVYITLFINGSGIVIDFPAKRQLMLDILGRNYIVKGNAIEGFMWQFSTLIGPLMAALFLSIFNVSSALFLICVFLFFNLLSAISVKYTYENLSVKNTKTKIRDYIILLSKNKAVLAVCGITIIMNIFMFPSQSLIPFIAVEVLGKTSTFSSIIISTAAVGSIITSISLLILDTKKIGLIFGFCTSLCLFFLFIYSFSTNYILSLFIYSIVGVGIAGFGATQASLIQLTTTTEERGIAMGVLAMCIGSGPIGSFLYGIFAENYTAQLAMRYLPISGFFILLLIIFFTKVIHKITIDSANKEIV
tara:strand:+ start:363 stop:1583 length:1221 start_codon:yes stop_codon:yes gene_type:complete